MPFSETLFGLRLMCPAGAVIIHIHPVIAHLYSE